MGLLTSISIRNFKCFRELISLDVGQGTYLIGSNNAGKTAVLQAINCFFNSDAFEPGFLNRTEFTRRQAGFNRSDITLTFDLSLVTGRVRHDRMRAEHGPTLQLTKSFTWREKSSSVAATYQLGAMTCEYEELSEDIRYLLECVTISYIHPQEGAELLRKAQDKFKKRLFHNWGRHASVSERLVAVQAQWNELRTTANSYLSRALTDRVRGLWPGSEVKVDLPARIEDIVAVSDITFRGAPNLPEVSLTAQGTGAQSSILYQTHFILDSDRSLHQGMYFPIWLLEEPESFLHADIAFQLGRLLASSEWQTHIQMLISTHSPIILAGSHQSTANNRWVVFDRSEVRLQLPVADATEHDIINIGTQMGDANFPVYFASASSGRVVIVEDSHNRTASAFANAGVPVAKSLGGISEVKKYLTVYVGVPDAVSAETVFIVDGDKGLRELQHLLQQNQIVRRERGWCKYRLLDNLFVIVLPENCAVEDLFDQWQDVLNETIDDLLEPDLSIKANIPARLSRIVDVLRRHPPADRDDAKAQIRSMQDTKDRFWQRVEEETWRISDGQAETLRQLLVQE